MIIDVNAYLGHWPFRQLRYNTAEKLIELMNKFGLDKTVVSSLNAIFYKNCQSGNEELATETREHRERFIPFATLNPMYPGWEDDFEQCVEEFNMKGLRLFPHYHNYKLTDDASIRLIHEATQRCMPVSIPMRMVDRRQRHWLDSARDLSLSEFEEIIKQCSETTFILTEGVGWENSQLVNVFKSCNFLIEISRLTSVLQESIPRLLDALGPTKLAFGTGMPFKYPRPALLKMEILEASEEVKEQIYWRNIAGILGDT
ncbi:metal-dependent hydrolase [Candidatus Poribacteria bacterium]|nr:metal-dependent hydrolase [Candidatus Poribacteria bacterium]